MYNSALEILCILCTVKFDFLEDVYLVLEERMLVFGGPDASIGGQDASILRTGC